MEPQSGVKYGKKSNQFDVNFYESVPQSLPERLTITATTSTNLQYGGNSKVTADQICPRRRHSCSCRTVAVTNLKAQNGKNSSRKKILTFFSGRNARKKQLLQWPHANNWFFQEKPVHFMRLWYDGWGTSAFGKVWLMC